MHMADALISPVVGATFTAASMAVGTWSARKLREDNSDERIPLMGVMGAFVFTAQMINFSIPGTGSSGHLGGGLLLAAVLGPHAAFLTITAILMVQALLFGDGGLLALGCNIFNLGFFPCFIAWPLIFKPVMGNGASRRRTLAGALLGAVVGLQAGAFSVVLQTVFSGRTELPFNTFFLLMQPIHLAIGIVEGLVTAAVVLFLLEHRPENLQGIHLKNDTAPSLKRKAAGFMILLSLITGIFLSSFASGNPDGLEWSILRASGHDELPVQGMVYDSAAAVQAITAILPDYNFENSAAAPSSTSINSGTAFSGLVGGTVILVILSAVGAMILNRKKRLSAKDRQEAI